MRLDGSTTRSAPGRGNAWPVRRSSARSSSLRTLQQQRQGGTSVGWSSREREPLVRHRLSVGDRIAPVVELDPFRQELGTEPVAGARNRVDAQGGPTHAANLWATGSGSTGALS